MDYSRKSDLISQLAKEMGFQGGTVRAASNFDAATGTLYVGSKVYTPEAIEEARVFLHSLADKYKPLGDNAYQAFEIAETTILLAQKQVAENKGRIVIEEG